MAQDLVAAGETLLEVSTILAVRGGGTGRSNKNDPNDALCVAIAALRTPWPAGRLPVHCFLGQGYRRKVPWRRETPVASERGEQGRQQVVEVVKKAQDAIIETVGKWSETAGKALPDLPSAPGADQLPQPEQVVENAFDLAQRLLDNQREFATRLVQAVEAGRKA